MTNESVLDKLKKADAQDVQSADLPLVLSLDEEIAQDQLKRDLARLPNEHADYHGRNSLAHPSDILDWETVLLRSYKNLSAQPPVLNALISVIPSPGTGAKAAVPSHSPPYDSPGAPETVLGTAADEEIKLLVKDWTNIPYQDLEHHLSLERMNRDAEVPGVPEWIRNESVTIPHPR